MTTEAFIRRWPTGVHKAELIEGVILFTWMSGPFDERDVAAAQLVYPGRVVRLTSEGNLKVHPAA
ncbi:hypothetical protein [Streptomyces flavidovirens]|uniref:hypothetical protein n=1 Tax=Streptomyces flavidovirens TaxID=67298 RepID=UPI003693494F